MVRYECNHNFSCAEVLAKRGPGLADHGIAYVTEGCYPGFISVQFDCTSLSTPFPMEAVPALIEALTAVHGKLTEGE